MENFNVNEIMSVGDVDALIAALRGRRRELKDVNKEAEKANKEKLMEETKEKIVALNLKEGDVVKFIFKGEETVGIFVKLTEKRFTALVDGDKKSIMFDKFIFA